MVLQGPGDLLYEHRGAVVRRGSMSFQHGEACGTAAEGIRMECVQCVLCSVGPC